MLQGTFLYSILHLKIHSQICLTWSIDKINTSEWYEWLVYKWNKIELDCAWFVKYLKEKKYTHNLYWFTEILATSSPQPWWDFPLKYLR